MENSNGGKCRLHTIILIRNISETDLTEREEKQNRYYGKVVARKVSTVNYYVILAYILTAYIQQSSYPIQNGSKAKASLQINNCHVVIKY